MIVRLLNHGPNVGYEYPVPMSYLKSITKTVASALHEENKKPLSCSKEQSRCRKRSNHQAPRSPVEVKARKELNSKYFHVTKNRGHAY